MDERLRELDVGALFHSLLFAYQRSLADTMGTKATQTMLPLAMSYLDKVDSTTAIGSIKGRTPEEVLTKLGQLLVRSRLAAGVSVKKTERGFVFSVENCIFADHVHRLLDPRDVTCPYGLIAMYLVQKNTGLPVADTLSTFTPTGSSTPIESSTESDVARYLRAWAGATG